jgi:hypothetical protein
VDLRLGRGRAALEELEVAALIRLAHMALVEAGPAALLRRLARR